MADANLIACLYPADLDVHTGRALYTVRMSENSSRHIRPQIVYNDDCCSRESSVSLEEEEEEEEGYMYGEGLELRFDHKGKNHMGILVGKSSDCDIVLPSFDNVRSASRYQCLFTFDKQGRLILQDLREPGLKKDGTFVTYDKQGGFKRRGFTWILNDNFTQDKDIIIAFHKNLQFRIVVAPHDVHSARYRENVDRFCLDTTANVDDLALERLGVQSMQSTAAPSEAKTPRRDAILLENGELGRGGQAVVKRMWDVSTGREYASKEPLEKKYWARLKKEASLLKRMSHVNIVELVGLTDKPEPQRLLLEYVPLGSLSAQAKQKPISAEENLEILRQGLAALRFLHERDEPVAHRDIKPDNILVHSRNPLHIKLSDFGFSKENQDGLKTGCGTRSYTAPEVYMGQRYDEAVDIWSLGVVVFMYAHGLPQWESQFDGVTWAGKVIDRLQEKASRQAGCLLLAFLSKAMLLFEAKRRYSARLCSAEACLLAVSPCCSPVAALVMKTNEDETTVTSDHQPASPDYPSEEDETTIRPGVENEGCEDGATVVFRDSEIMASPKDLRSSWECSTASTDGGRSAISHAPPAESRAQVSKQPRSASASSSSSHRRTKRARCTRSTTSQQLRPQSEVGYFYNKFSDPLHSLYVGSSVGVFDNTDSRPSESSGHPAPCNPVGSESSLLPEWLPLEGPQLIEAGPEVPLRDASSPRTWREDRLEGPVNASDEYVAAALLFSLHDRA